MLILGHMGVTLAVPWVVGKGLGRLRRHSPLALDYRLVVLGSLFPDVVDKTLGMGLFPQEIGNGRTIAHTLLFNLALIATGVLGWRLGAGVGALTLALSSGGHLLLDQMWKTPATLFWPLYGWSFPGWSFPQSQVTGRVGDSWPMFPSPTAIQLPELIGGAILLLFLLQLWRRGGLVGFLKTGHTGGERAGAHPPPPLVGIPGVATSELGWPEEAQVSLPLDREEGPRAAPTGVREDEGVPIPIAAEGGMPAIPPGLGPMPAGVLRSFSRAVRTVMGASGEALKPGDTLREFLGRVRGRGVGEEFVRLTFLAERALYSPHLLTPQDVQEAAELCLALERRLGGGGA